MKENIILKDFNIRDLEYMSTRFTPLPTGDPFLDHRYEWQKISNGVEWPYYRFFYHLSKMLRPDIILELGGWQGTAAAHFAAGWDAATVITVDHHSDPGDEHNQDLMFECQERYVNLYYYQGWTTAKAAMRNKGKHALGDVGNVYNNIIDHTFCAGKKIDILFIDSWHHYDYAKDDWETYKPFLNSPALVICDDIIEDVNSGDPIHGMMRFWEELPDSKFLNTNLNPSTRIGFAKYE